MHACTHAQCFRNYYKFDSSVGLEVVCLLGHGAVFCPASLLSTIWRQVFWQPVPWELFMLDRSWWGGLAVVCVWDLAPADPELTLLINPDRRCFRAWQGCWQATEACKKPPHTNWEVFKSERVFINHVHHMRVKGCCQALFLKRWEKLLANRWLSGDVVGCSIRRDCAYRVVPLPWRILLGNIKY